MAQVAHEACVEAAVIGIPHEIKGQGVFAFCILKDGVEETPELIPSLKQVLCIGADEREGGVSVGRGWAEGGLRSQARRKLAETFLVVCRLSVLPLVDWPRPITLYAHRDCPRHGPGKSCAGCVCCLLCTIPVSCAVGQHRSAE